MRRNGSGYTPIAKVNTAVTPSATRSPKLDVSGPLSTAWQLHKRWTTTRLHILEDGGHGGGNEFKPLVIRTLDEFGKL